MVSDDLSPDDVARLALVREKAIRAKREGVLLIRQPLRPGDVARSFIGGLPFLPEQFDWPVSKRTGLPLNFIAQIDLRDVPRPQGVFFPAEGTLWFFADFSQERFFREEHTRVLFEPRARIEAPERQAPAKLPPLHPGGDPYGWVDSGHPRAFVELKAGLSMHLFDTFHDWIHCEAPDEQSLEPVVYMKMIDELREEALRRAIGVDRSQQGGYWYKQRSGYGEAHWPATSIDAEYALMALTFDLRVFTGTKNQHCPPERATALEARLQDQIAALRGLGLRPLSPAERDSIAGLAEEVRDCTQRSRRNTGNAVGHTYPYAAFEIMSRMPDAEKYVPAELLHPYQELMLGSPIYVHQMFGHGSSPQDATHTYADFALLLQLGGNRSLGFPLMGDAAMHYWIPRQDLAIGRFDRVEGTWEAG